MTTLSPSSIIAQDTSAHFQAWVTEVIASLLTVGITQTADTGQMTNPCTTAVPGSANISAGYYMFAFNDALQGSAPIYFKIEVGSASPGANCPQIWITVGTGTNGAGTVTGVVMARCSVTSQSVPYSIVTAFNSRFCYVASQGYLAMVWKQGATAAATTYQPLGGFLIFRSVNNTGAPTADSVHLLTNANTAGGSTGGSSNLQLISYNTNASYSGTSTPPISNGATWGFAPFNSSSTIQGSSAQVFPCWQWSGSTTLAGYGITNAHCGCISVELPLNTTTSLTILGSLSLTYLSVASIAGNTFWGAGSPFSIGNTAGTWSSAILWQ